MSWNRRNGVVMAAAWSTSGVAPPVAAWTIGGDRDRRPGTVTPAVDQQLALSPWTPLRPGAACTPPAPGVPKSVKAE